MSCFYLCIQSDGFNGFCLIHSHTLLLQNKIVITQQNKIVTALQNKIVIVLHGKMQVIDNRI